MSIFDTTDQHHTVTLTKLSQRRLQDKVIASNVEKLLKNVYSKSMDNAGWTVDASQEVFTSLELDDTSSDNFENHLHFTITFSHPKRTPESTELEGIVRKIASSASQNQQGRWTLTEVDGERYQPHSSIEGAEQDDAEFGYAPVSLPDDFESYFSHLYGLDSQITRVRRALETGIMTGWQRRENCVLYGPPGCGKSDVALSLKRALGEEAVWSIDGTAMTSAGIAKELEEREILPRILVIEEIEKAQSDEAVSVMLSILDQRGEIRKTTARGNVQRDTKCFAIVTVNDFAKYKRMRAGALRSRTPQVIKFNRPGREVLTQILEREIERMGGDLAWIEPTLDFADKHDISDPRTVTSICLCGREMLLTDEYQEMLEETMDMSDLEEGET